MRRKICSFFLVLVLCTCLVLSASAHSVVCVRYRWTCCGWVCEPMPLPETQKPAVTEKQPDPVSAEEDTPAEPAPAEQAPEIPEAENPVQPLPARNVGYEEQVVLLVNQERAANGLAPLQFSETLSDGARLKSRDLHDNRYFDHTSPTYGSPFEMMRSLGITYSYAGENIAMGYDSPEAVVRAWMNSPGHRANILSPNYSSLGVGYVADGGYWTQWFHG